METFRQRRPKISSFSADQSFTDLLPSTASDSFKGPIFFLFFFTYF